MIEDLTGHLRAVGGFLALSLALMFGSAAAGWHDLIGPASLSHVVDHGMCSSIVPSYVGSNR
jgi:hypothetical protein